MVDKSDPIRILHVEDERGALEITNLFLKTDYKMPGMDEWAGISGRAEEERERYSLYYLHRQRRRARGDGSIE